MCVADKFKTAASISHVDLSILSFDWNANCAIFIDAHISFLLRIQLTEMFFGRYHKKTYIIEQTEKY